MVSEGLLYVQLPPSLRNSGRQVCISTRKEAPGKTNLIVAGAMCPEENSSRRVERKGRAVSCQPASLGRSSTFERVRLCIQSVPKAIWKVTGAIVEMEVGVE